MESYIVDWLNLLSRWIHMITGIAWIGASFYFVWLDNHLLPPKDPEDEKLGVGGEVWSVHGGGFYHAQKYKLTPPKLPEDLHWFKWEAYSTWLSGIFLMALIYWYGAEIYTIDPNVAELSKPVAILIGIACLAGGWIVYDQLCKSPLGKNDKALGIVIAIFVFVVAFVLCKLFGGRAAYLHFGAMLGTIMVANVFFVIMPGQQELVDATKENRTPDASHGLNAKQRSVHNTYFTLPVLFVMISNHYAMTYGHEYNWLILIGISIAGALIRVYFVQRHFGKASLIPVIVAVVIVAAIAATIAPKATSATSSATQQASSAFEQFAKVKTVLDQRCNTCHAASPTQPGFSAAPKGMAFETPEQITSQALLIHQQTVVTKAMPIGNLTRMTDDERALVDRWFKDGAKTE